ncbi:glycosyltransferase [Bacillus rubiinfantis]|uniref:glycosyltransferase n=1 Tax=Bacillus rubiinfantis TaxID=1499680 RepID=UPI000AC8BDAB|nr:glycosyltransferase [Bacillus rubiinfantis]
MQHNAFLTFHGTTIVRTKEPLLKDIQNTFTIEFWAKPKAEHIIGPASVKRKTNIIKQQFAIAPVFGALNDGNLSRAGVGVSVGTNGIAVYEHTTNYFPVTLAYPVKLPDWTHIAVVYENKRPSLYVNGQYIKKGTTSRKNVVPSAIFGGIEKIGYFTGNLREIRIWNRACTRLEIQEFMNKELTGREPGLCGYWKLNGEAGNIAVDSSPRCNDGYIESLGPNKENSKGLKPKQVKVLFTFVVPSGGVETLNRQRFNALQQKGLTCHFLYKLPGTGLQNKINTTIHISNNDSEIKNLIESEKYDAIVVVTDVFLLEKIRRFGYKGRLIYEVQGIGFNKEYAEHFMKTHASLIELNSDALLYPKTPHLIQVMEKYFPAKRKFCFHNCFDTTEFHYKQLPKQDQPIIGWVGRLEENKNWRDFLKIGAAFIKTNPSIQLWMFQDDTLAEPKERSAFEKMLEQLNLRQHITVFSNEPHHKMANYFSIIGDSGGFLCSTSKVEGFGYAVLEAMVCRCPVLSTDSDGVRSFIKHNKTGKFFELGNLQQAIAEGMEYLTNESLRATIRANGVSHIERHFSLEQYGDHFLQMINSL